MKDFEDIIESKYIKYNEPMSKHTSIKVGGNADIYIEVTDSKKMQEILKLAKEKGIKITIIGNGTNLIISDEGIRGLVIKYIANNIIIQKENSDSKINMIVEAGAINAVVAKQALQKRSIWARIHIRNTWMHCRSSIYECRSI